VALTAIALMGFVHIMNWNEYSFSVIPLKLASAAGYADKDDNRELSKICLARKKYDCQEHALNQLSFLEPKNKSVFEELARVQKKLKSPNIFMTHLRYMNFKKDLNTETLHIFAIALEKNNKWDESFKLYTRILKDKNYKHRTTATRDYVRLLVSEKKFLQARRTIIKFRRKNKGANYFLKKELKNINRSLASQI